MDAHLFHVLVMIYLLCYVSAGVHRERPMREKGDERRMELQLYNKGWRYAGKFITESKSFPTTVFLPNIKESKRERELILYALSAPPGERLSPLRPATCLLLQNVTRPSKSLDFVMNYSWRSATPRSTEDALVDMLAHAEN